MLRKLLGAMAAAALFCVTGATQGQALTPLLSISDLSGLPLGNGPFTLGWEFDANAAVTIRALGVFDDNQDGLGQSHEVGLFNGTGTLLASATVASGTVDPL